MRTNGELEAVADRVEQLGRDAPDDAYREVLRGLSGGEVQRVLEILRARFEETEDRVRRLGPEDAAHVEDVLGHFNRPEGEVAP
jgi:hypothetical protein